MTSEFAPSRHRGRVLYFSETALRGERTGKIGNSIQNKYGNAPMIGSNNAESWKVVARFFCKRMTICAAADGAGHAMLGRGY
jgi:hypothetical protein